MNAMENQMAVNRVYHPGHVTKIDARIRKAREMFDSYVSIFANVLDVGCGDGVILAPFTKQRRRITGVECFQPFHAQALANGYHRVINFDLNIVGWPIADATYDAVFSGETSEHQTDLDLFFSEINRVMKMYGEFIYTFPNIRTPIGLAMMLFQNRPPMSSARYRSPHFKDFTTSTAKLALENNGFKVQEMVGSSFGTTTPVDVLPGLATHFPSWASQVIVFAEKVREAKYNPLEMDFDIYRK